METVQELSELNAELRVAIKLIQKIANDQKEIIRKLAKVALDSEHD